MLKNNRMPSELVRLSLEKAIALQGSLSAFTVLQDEATLMEAAYESDRRYEQNSPLGPLDGLPLAIKDNFCTDGLPTTCGSKMLEPFVPTYNATVVNQTLTAGGLVIGKVSTLLRI